MIVEEHEIIIHSSNERLAKLFKSAFLKIKFGKEMRYQ
jgi:hypothetical protein